MASDTDLHQPVNEIGQRQSRKAPKLGIHGDAGEARQGVDFIHVQRFLVRQEIDPCHAAPADSRKGSNRRRPHLCGQRLRQIRRQLEIGFVLQVLVLVVVEIVARYDLAYRRGFEGFVAENRALQLASSNLLLHDDRVVELQRELEGLAEVFAAIDSSSHRHSSRHSWA